MAHISLSIALSHVIAFLTSPLHKSLSMEHIERVRICLDVNLTKDFEKIWCPAEPKRFSGARCLTLSPNKLPPRPLLTACHAARIRWSQWITALGGEEMDIFIDPGCVSVRKGAWGTAASAVVTTVWSAPTASVSFNSVAAVLPQVVVEDTDSDEMFSLIEQQRCTATWMAPLLQQFPTVPLAIDTSPKALAPTRSSSPSSSDSEFSSPPSLVDSDSASDASSVSTTSKSSAKRVYVPPGRRARTHATTWSLADAFVIAKCASAVSAASASSSDDEGCLSGSRARQIPVHVDASKVAVTPYDGGKTTVLTGGTMLGMKKAARA